MKYIITPIVLFTVLINAQSVNAQMFAGYDSFCGLPVIVGQDPQSASARTDRLGNKFIHVDPSVMSNWSMSRMFALAHECAHHLLGHTNGLGQLQRYHGGTKKQELEADCWAASALTELGYNSDITRTILERANQGHFSSGGYPSGYERARNISNCANGGIGACELVEVPEEYMDIEWVIQQARIPCQHCGCDYYRRCGCQHQFDIVPQQAQVPVRRVRYVTKEVCHSLP